MADSLEEQIGKALLRHGWTVALAESCTGGLIGHRLTNVPGSSAYFLGSIVAYAYEAKEHLLGVSHQTLYEHGAVSRETAVEMARGARRSLSSDLGMSVTGIAGPGGGLPDKPVGLTWVAISRREGDLAERYLWKGDRIANKEQSAEAALRFLLETLDNP